MWGVRVKMQCLPDGTEGQVIMFDMRMQSCEQLSHACLGCRGVGAASLRVIPMAVVSFGTYEAVRLWLTALEEHLRQHRSADGMQESQPVCVSNK